MIRTLIILTAFVLSTEALSYPDDKIEHLDSGKIFSDGDNLPFSEAVRVGNTIYLSGQIGIIPKSKKLISGGIKEETKQTLSNIKTILKAHGLTMNNVAKCTVMLADISEWPAFNEVYKEYFTSPYPARSAFAANGLAFGARVEVDCIAISH